MIMRVGSRVRIFVLHSWGFFNNMCRFGSGGQRWRNLLGITQVCVLLPPNFNGMLGPLRYQFSGSSLKGFLRLLPTINVIFPMLNNSSMHLAFRATSLISLIPF